MAGRKPKDGIRRDKLMAMRMPVEMHARLRKVAADESIFEGKQVTMSDVAIRAIRREINRRRWRLSVQLRR